MAIRIHRGEGPGLPREFDPLTMLVFDHLLYAEKNPEELEKAAAKLGGTTLAALAVLIASSILDE